MRRATRNGGLPACWPAAEDLSLCLDTAGRWTVADQVERIGFATAPLRLPSLGAAIGPARGADQSQEALSALQGGALDRAQAGWPQTGTGHPGADGDPAGSEPALVARLRDGHALQRPSLPSSDLVDDFTRECLGLVVDTSLTALRVVRELGKIIESRGCSCMIVSDNGTEFTSNAILAWQEGAGHRVALHCTRKADAERFCRKLQRSPA